MATIQYHVVQILEFLYLLPSRDSKIVARNGGIAKDKYPIGCGNTRFEKYAITIMLNPVTSAI